jgi:hypothetical protein
MKKPIKLLCLVLVLALLLGAYVLLTRQTDEEDAEEAVDDSVSLYLVNSNDIKTMSWTCDGETYTVTRNDDDTWSCDEGYPLDATMLDTLADTLSAVVAARIVPVDDGDLAEFQLDEPVMTVSVATGTTEATFYVGLHNAYTDQDYAQMAGQDTVYLLETDLSGTFDLTLLDLVQLDALDDYDTTRTLTVQTDDADFTMVHPEDNTGLGYADSFTWFTVDEDGNYSPLDATATASLAATVTGLDWLDCVAYAPASLADYGLDEPTATVTIDYDLSEGGSATAVLLIGAVAEYEEVDEVEDEAEADDFDTDAANSDLAAMLGDLGLDLEDGDEAAAHAETTVSDDPTEPQSLSYYAMLEGSDLVCRLSADTVQKILDATPESLLPEDVCLIDWDTLTAMTFTIDGQEYQFLIRRTEDQDDDGNLTETVTCSFNGQQTDETSVKAILSAVTGLDAQTTVSGGAETDGDPEITIRFSRDRDTYSVMTMTLTPYDLNFYVVDFAGRNDQLVSIRDVAALVDAVTGFEP